MPGRIFDAVTPEKNGKENKLIYII